MICSRGKNPHCAREDFIPRFGVIVVPCGALTYVALFKKNERLTRVITTGVETFIIKHGGERRYEIRTSGFLLCGRCQISVQSSHRPRYFRVCLYIYLRPDSLYLCSQPICYPFSVTSTSPQTPVVVNRLFRAARGHHSTMSTNIFPEPAVKPASRFASKTQDVW